MSIAMLRLAVTVVAAFAASPGSAEDQRACIGTYRYTPMQECPRAPGNLKFARFAYSGKLRLQGTFESLPGGPLDAVARVSLDPGFPVDYAFRGEGQCVGDEKQVSGIIKSTGGGRHDLTVGDRFINVVYTARTKDDKRWTFSAPNFDAECTLQ